MKECRKCKALKHKDDFHKHPKTKDGLNTVCKECKNLYAKQYRAKNPEKVKLNNKKFKKKYLAETNGYAVYYLPEEHYVGFTNNVRTRMNDHSKRGKITYGYEIIGIYKCPIDAHLTETLLHKMGYNGFQHKY